MGERGAVARVKASVFAKDWFPLGQECYTRTELLTVCSPVIYNTVLSVLLLLLLLLLPAVICGEILYSVRLV